MAGALKEGMQILYRPRGTLYWKLGVVGRIVGGEIVVINFTITGPEILSIEDIDWREDK